MGDKGETDLFAVSGQDSLFEHASGKDLKHSSTFFHAFLLGEKFFVVFVRDVFFILAVSRPPKLRRGIQTRTARQNSLVFSIVFTRVTAIFVLVARLVFERLGSFSIALNTFVGELLHHLEEFLTIVLEELVGDREDSFL